MSVGEQFGTQLVVADGADGEAFRAVLGRMVCEIDGCAAGTLAGGEHIPQDFAERNDDWLGHGVPFFGCGVLCDVKEHRRMFQKIGDGHGRGTADGGVRWEVGQGDFGIVPDFGDGTFPNDFFDLVKQGLSGLGDDVAEYDMRRIEGVDDIDRAYPIYRATSEVRSMAALSPAAALANSAVHACACVIASHPGTMLGCSLSRSWIALAEQ